MMVLLLAGLIGVVAGLRAMTAPAAVSWGASWGWLDLEGTWLAFLGYAATPYILTLLALGELITDKLPATPSRKVPVQFAARIASGAICGAALGVAGGSMLSGLVAGALGAVLGTLGSADMRRRLARAVGRDLPAALTEDAVAIAGALLIVAALP